MAPPASFITITTIPFSRVVTQAEFNVDDEIWFKYTATVPICLGCQVTNGGTFVSETRVFESDGTTQVSPGSSTVPGTDGFWNPLETAGDYYIQVVRQGGGASDFDFTFNADTRPLNEIGIVPGDMLINDDANSIPGYLMSSAGATRTFVSAIPAGEIGAILPNNISFWHDRFGQHHATNLIAIFDANLNYVTSVQAGLNTIYQPCFAVDLVNNRIYLINQLGELWTVSSAGVAANTGYVFPTDIPNTMAINETATRLYWTIKSRGNIRVLDLLTLTPLADLYTIPGFVNGDDRFNETGNLHNGDMFVLPNGNVVGQWFDLDTFTSNLIIVNSAGVLQNTYDFPYATEVINHLAYIHDSNTHMMMWQYIDVGFTEGKFSRINLLTGVQDQDFVLPMFSIGQNMGGTDMFGPSNSCTFVLFTIVSGTFGGLYILIPDKTDDTINNSGSELDVAIPDPTFKTGLLG